MLNKIMQSPLYALLISTGIILLSFLVLTPLDTSQIMDALDYELDILTYCCYAFALGIMISHLSVFQTKREKIHLALFFVIYTFAILREMGIQHWLAKTLGTTATTAFKLRFFSSPDNPLSAKIISGLILLSVIASLLYLLIFYAPKLTKGFFKYQTLSWTTATLAGVGIAGKIVDRLPSNLKKADIQINESTISLMKVFEESSEMCLPLICAVWFVQFSHIKSSKK
ncbi:MAG: hypothetical protein IJ440_01465 [Alphaproteobacteria bacterium]|nr:hypothetical protein [Alphaproteobacteria bacterium]